MALPAQPTRSFKKRKTKKTKKTALERKLDGKNSQEAKASAQIMAKILGRSSSNMNDDIQYEDQHVYEDGQDTAWTDDEDDDKDDEHRYVTFQERT